ncbi:MAG: heme NO-binding domain-containing protein [Bacteroidota bacterium]
MKGMVFTEFLEMVEDRFGFEVADKIVENATLDSKGVYSAVGTYDHQEMVNLVVELSKETQVQVPDLLYVYGKHLFERFSEGYSVFFKNMQGGAFGFLKGIDNYIHVEVRKLYPDAELPGFDISQPDDRTLEMVYSSERKLGDFALGLIDGCLQHFDESASVARENIREDGSKVKFTITKA